MRVITEERLRELLNSGEFSNFNRERNLLVTLLNHLEEIDTLTVSKLRPMCESPLIDGFMVKLKTENDLHEGNFDSLGNVWIGDQYFPVDLCEGWIPVPTYKPELTGEVEQCE